MKRPFPFYPPLLAIFPVVAVFSANLALMPIGDLWRPLGIGLAGGISVWLLCAALFRSFERGSVVAAVGICAFWIYAPLTNRIDVDAPYLVAGAFCLIFAALAYWLSKKRIPTLFLNRLAAFVILVGALQIGWHWYRFSAGGSREVAKGVAEGRPPDIFYIILDGYGRSDQLKKNLNFDNSAFVEGLKKLGFYVPDRNHSNYCQTAISLSSSLNMDFIQTLLPKEGPSSGDRSPLNNLVNDSLLARDLRSKGYTNIAITTGFPSFEFPHADLRLQGPKKITLFESTLLEMTPFGDVKGAQASMFTQRRAMLEASFTNLERLAKPTAAPRFVFAHILAPHPPFVFNADGSERPKKGPFGYWDGSDYMTYMGSPEDYREGYVGQATYLSKRMLEVVEKLLSTSGQKPIVILQGDHGSKLHLDQAEAAKTDMNECFSNLEALYVPEPIKAKLYPEITPVNFFRIILSSLFGENLPNLPDRSYYSPFPTPYAFLDVTDQVKGPPANLNGK